MIRPGVRPGPFRVVALLLVLAACTNGHTGAPLLDVHQELAVRAGAPTSTTTTTVRTSTTRVRSDGSRPTAAPRPTTSPTAPSEAILRATDPRGDIGPVGPSYADMVGVLLDRIGDSAQVTVQLAGRLPSPVSSSEVMGIGVNLYRAGAKNSGYQVFADGEPDGWYGYLEAGTTFVKYPGSLVVSGSSIVFTVPWSSLGDLRSGQLDAFVDWSRDKVATSDHLPDQGSLSWSR